MLDGNRLELNELGSSGSGHRGGELDGGGLESVCGELLFK